MFRGKAEQVNALKNKLATLGPPHPLTAEEEQAIKPLLDPLVGHYFGGHSEYYSRVVEVFEPVLRRLNGLASARLQLNITSNDDKLIYEDEIKPISGQKVDAKFLKSLDTALYAGRESNGRSYAYGASPVVRDARRQVRDFYVDFLEIRAGWFGVGPKKAVPHDACYVGRFRDQYAWVLADGRKDLAEFTIKTLGYATMIKDQSITTIPGGPRYSPSIPTR